MIFVWKRGALCIELDFMWTFKPPSNATIKLVFVVYQVLVILIITFTLAFGGGLKCPRYSYFNTQ